MMTIHLRLASNIDRIYAESLTNIIKELNKELELHSMRFSYEEYLFTSLEADNLRTDANVFIHSKVKEKRENPSLLSYNSIIYIPNIDINIERNYLWWSSGEPGDHIMVVSSFLYERSLKKHMDYGAYCVLLYCQFLARFSVNIDHPHDESKDCLNDFCANQTEILNVFRSGDVLCDYCLSRVKHRVFHETLNIIISYLKQRHYKGSPIPEQVSEKEKSLKLPVMKSFENYSYEIEIFIAKKCINLLELYKKIDELLRNPNTTIEGYSLYEVDGGWRGQVYIEKHEKEDWNTLMELKLRYGEGAFKDLIKPIFETKGGVKRYALFDERSIVLKIVITLEDELKKENIVGPQTHPAFKEVAEIFEKITENEKSVFYTIKQLYDTGVIKKTI